MSTYAANGQYGPVAIPATAPAAGEAVTDKALTILGAYLKAFLNAYGHVAWQAAGVAPSVPPVKLAFAHDPREVSINARDFPSLYLFRTGGAAPEQIAEDWRLTTDNVAVLWIFPREANQEIARTRRPWQSGLTKLIDDAIWRMRDPCYVVPGDPDPIAIAQGSDVFGIAHIIELRPVDWKPTTIAIPGGDGGPGDAYPAVLYGMTIRERDVRGVGGLDSPYGLDFKQTYPDGDSTVRPETEYENGP